VRLLFAGVRGSTPVSGREFERVGGRTSCVAVLRDHEHAPALILDAGTGIMNLAEPLGTEPFVGTILLSHLHWDHVQGLPFFRSADRDDAHVTVAIPAQGDPRAVLQRALSPPHFPIGTDGLLGTWNFVALEAGTHGFEGFDVTALDVPHKGGRTFGYRVSDGTRAFAYLPDHGPRGPDASEHNRAGALELARGVDVLVHGAPFTNDERAMADRYGHATVDDATDLATAAGVPRLVLTHHGPARSDAAVDALAARARIGFGVPLLVATEGCALDV
jgi:phosphoribosyl 1,2-cyclic phosphodiesterase